MANHDITPNQLKHMQDDSDKLFVLDVREPHEIDICAIEGTHKIPLGDMPTRFSEVPTDMPVVVHCKLGGRSAQAVAFLQAQGYNNVKNLAGGIIRWIDDVDDSLTRY